MSKDMNGISLHLPTPSLPLSSLPPPQLRHRGHLPLQLIPRQLARPSPAPACRCSGRGEGFGWGYGQRRWWGWRRRRAQHHHHHPRASWRESPYEVLGVSPSATPQELKRAYRSLALKFHPDVNKEANAQEKFMRIKHAYNILLNSESQLKYNFSNRGSDYSSSNTERNRSWKTEEAEEFYGFEDFFKDLQAEFQNWETRAGSQEKPKSLWEELADIGEEFVEFLENELNITDLNSQPENVGGRPSKENTNGKSGSEKTGDKVRSDDKESTIEDNIDEIEAALAQLKRELGL